MQLVLNSRGCDCVRWPYLGELLCQPVAHVLLYSTVTSTFTQIHVAHLHPHIWLGFIVDIWICILPPGQNPHTGPLWQPWTSNTQILNVGLDTRKPQLALPQRCYRRCYRRCPCNTVGFNTCMPQMHVIILRCTLISATPFKYAAAQVHQLILQMLSRSNTCGHSPLVA